MTRGDSDERQGQESTKQLPGYKKGMEIVTGDDLAICRDRRQ